MTNNIDCLNFKLELKLELGFLTLEVVVVGQSRVKKVGDGVLQGQKSGVQKEEEVCKWEKVGWKVQAEHNY